MPLFELVVLIIVLLAGLSIVWSTLKTGMSPMMSSSKARHAMLAEIKPSAEGPLVDLGSGWGTLVIAVARTYPHQSVVGYELSWLPWLVSHIRKSLLGLNNLTLYRKDFTQADLNDTAIFICYLFPKAMIALEEKLKREHASSTLVISNTFALPSCQATRVVRLSDIYQTPIYVYNWPSALSIDT